MPVTCRCLPGASVVIVVIAVVAFVPFALVGLEVLEVFRGTGFAVLIEPDPMMATVVSGRVIVGAVPDIIERLIVRVALGPYHHRPETATVVAPEKPAVVVTVTGQKVPMPVLALGMVRIAPGA